MIKISNLDVWGFEHAIRGMRNSHNSWENSDSYFIEATIGEVGHNDLKLMHSLYLAGPSHRKYMRQIMASMDIVAPLYWWKEFDTYKVGTCANSCSTMHMFVSGNIFKPDLPYSGQLFMSDFSTDKMAKNALPAFANYIEEINKLIYRFVEGKRKDKELWYTIIQMLPSSYNQKRTVTMNYENCINIIDQRSNHKLSEWIDFTNYLKRHLPYLNAIISPSDEEE